MPQISIDDVAYELEDLSDVAKQQLAHTQFADAEIQRLQMQLALAQTARAVYATALKESLRKE